MTPTPVVERVLGIAWRGLRNRVSANASVRILNANPPSPSRGSAAYLVGSVRMIVGSG